MNLDNWGTLIVCVCVCVGGCMCVRRSRGYNCYRATSWIGLSRFRSYLSSGLLSIVRCGRSLRSNFQLFMSCPHPLEELKATAVPVDVARPVPPLTWCQQVACSWAFKTINSLSCFEWLVLLTFCCKNYSFDLLFFCCMPMQRPHTQCFTLVSSWQILIRKKANGSKCDLSLVSCSVRKQPSFAALCKRTTS